MPKYDTLQRLADKLGPEEPVFPLRAQDLLAPAAVEAYALVLEAVAATTTRHGEPLRAQLQRQAEAARLFADRMRQWQTVHAASVKLPD